MTSEYPFVELNYSNFFISAALTDFSRKAIPLDESLFNIKFTLVEHHINNGRNIYNIKDLDFLPCNEIKINHFAEEFNKKSRLLEGHSCISNFSLTIGGDSSQLKEMWLDIRIFECYNSSPNYSCRPKSELKEFFHDKFFVLNTMDKYVEIDDYSNPVKTKISNFIKQISYNFYHGITHLYELLHIDTDDGIIFENLSETNHFIFKNQNNEFIMYPEILDYSRTFVQYTIKMTDKISNYKRKYLKAQELAADLGGIFQFYILIGKLIIDLTTHNLIYMELINRIYSFKTEENLLISNNTIRSDRKLNSFNDLLEIRLKKIKIYKNNNKITSENISEYTTSDILCYSFFCRSKKHHPRLQLFDKLKNEFEGFLEVGKFILAYKDIESLTTILLNPEQRSGIHFKNRRYILENSPNDNYESNLDKMIDYFNANLRKCKLSDIDKKIFKNLRKEIKLRIRDKYFKYNL